MYRGCICICILNLHLAQGHSNLIFSGQPNWEKDANPTPLVTFSQITWQFLHEKVSMEKSIEFLKDCNIIFLQILGKILGLLVRLEKLGQPQGWLGWPVPTAL